MILFSIDNLQKLPELDAYSRLKYQMVVQLGLGLTVNLNNSSEFYFFQKITSLIRNPLMC